MILATNSTKYIPSSATGNYIESVDSRESHLQVLRILLQKSQNFFVDLGIDLGTLNLSGDSGRFGSTTSIWSGISLSLYPLDWVPSRPWLSVRNRKIEIERTKCDGGVDQHTSTNSWTTLFSSMGSSSSLLTSICWESREIKAHWENYWNTKPQNWICWFSCLLFGYRFGGGGGESSNENSIQIIVL